MIKAEFLAADIACKCIFWSTPCRAGGGGRRRRREERRRRRNRKRRRRRRNRKRRRKKRKSRILQDGDEEDEETRILPASAAPASVSTNVTQAKVNCDSVGQWKADRARVSDIHPLAHTKRRQQAPLRRIYIYYIYEDHSRVGAGSHIERSGERHRRDRVAGPESQYTPQRGAPECRYSLPRFCNSRHQIGSSVFMALLPPIIPE